MVDKIGNYGQDHHMPTDTVLVTISEAARIAGVSPSTIRRWELQGRIGAPRRTLGGHRRYVLSDVEAMIAAPAAWTT